MSTEDRIFLGFLGALGTLLLIVVLGLASVAVDGVQDYRAYGDKIVCLKQHQKPERRYMSTLVSCVPPMERQDTTTVNVR